MLTMRSRNVAWIGIMTLGVIWTSCDGSEARDRGSDPTVRDSAGIRIVDFQSDVWLGRPTWELSRNAKVELTQEQGVGRQRPYEFFRVGGLGRLTTGAVVALNSGMQEIAVFDAAGRYVRTAR